MLSFCSSVARQSSAGCRAVRHIERLRSAILEQLHAEADSTRLVGSTGRVFLQGRTQDGNQQDGESRLREYVEELATISSFPEVQDRTRWNSTIESCQLQLLAKYEFLLEQVYGFACELRSLGHPDRLRNNV